MSSTDGIYSDVQLTLRNKYVSIACNADRGACVWQGATGKLVVYIKNNGGTSTLSQIVVKDGDAPSGNGGGLYLLNSNVVLILVAFIDNAASARGGAIYVNLTGSSSVTLEGCSFAGNTAIYGPDVYNDRKTVVIGGCPSGEDKPIRPSPRLSRPPLTNPPPSPPLPPPSPPLPPLPPPSSLRRLCSNPRFCPEQPQHRRHNDLPRVQLLLPQGVPGRRICRLWPKLLLRRLSRRLLHFGRSGLHELPKELRGDNKHRLYN